MTVAQSEIFRHSSRDNLTKKKKKKGNRKRSAEDPGNDAIKHGTLK